MTHDADGKPDLPKRSDGDLSGRLDRLGQELQRRSPVAPTENGGKSRFSGSDASGFARAARLSSDFIGGVVAGGIVGWLFDHFLGTKPWGLIVFLLLGFVAGTLNVMRSAGLTTGKDGDGKSP